MQVIAAAGGGWVAVQKSAGFAARFFALNLWTGERVDSSSRTKAKRLAASLAKMDGDEKMPDMLTMLERAERFRAWTF